MPKDKVQVSTTYNGTGVYGVTINHVVTKGEVVFAVWSEKNGQDDLKWYGAKSVGPTTYEATFDSKQYTDAGNYMIHVYQKLDGKMQFLASSTQYVERNRYEMPVYSQRDGRWGGLQYGLFNLSTASCVPTALSMVFSSLTNQDIKPTTVANYLYHQTNHFNKYFIGTSSLGIFEASKNWGLNTTVLNSQSALENALKEGHYVVAAVQYNKFVATGSHEIVLKGYQNGQTLVADPYTGKTEWYPVSRIFLEASTDKDDTAHKGKPFIKITD